MSSGKPARRLTAREIVAILVVTILGSVAGVLADRLLSLKLKSPALIGALSGVVAALVTMAFQPPRRTPPTGG